MGVKLIVLAVIVLAVIAVAQIMRVYELSSKLKGHKEEDVDLKANNMNAGLFLVFLTIFFGSFFYMLIVYGYSGVGPAASEHGEKVDWLFDVNWIIVIAVFLLTNFLLFYFAYKYSYHPDRKAYYFPHDNKLELLWTIAPAITMAVIIIFGLMTWNSITGKPSDDAVVVELYAKQFDFTIRYSGDDNKLGYADYKLVDAAYNPLGIATEGFIDTRIADIDTLIMENQARLDSYNSDTGQVALSSVNQLKLQRENEKMGRIQTRIRHMKSSFKDSTSVYSSANDDFYTKNVIFLIKDQEYQFVFRSQDVIHSAYFPAFRAQMNCVPGMRTTLKFKPLYTTQEMKDKMDDQNYEYILMCNKICGASHYKMNMPVYVGTKEEFKNWVYPTGDTPPNVTWIDPSNANAPEGE